VNDVSAKTSKKSLKMSQEDDLERDRKVNKIDLTDKNSALENYSTI
jgi:hypothetical protein